MKDDRNIKIDKLLAKLDEQQNFIKQIMSITDEEQKIINAIKEEVENDISTDRTLVTDEFFNKILKKRNMEIKEGYIYELWGRPFVIDNSIKSEFQLV